MNNRPVKPVAEYLVNGPIPADEFQDIKYLDLYIERGVVDTLPDIHFMLEYVCVHGAPKWWKGTVPEFEQEFHERYHQNTAVDKQRDNDATWQAAYAEVEAGRAKPISEDADDQQVEEFLSHGRLRRKQVNAVELLMDMWMEKRAKNELL